MEAWGDGVAYATKAFLCVAMARLAHEEGMCLDVSTGGELHVALVAGVPADRLVLHGNNKSDAELAAALEVGVGRIVVDSFDEIDRIERLAVRRSAGSAAASPAQGAGPDHPGRRGPHPRVRADRAGRLQVRLRVWPRGPPTGRSTGSARSTPPASSSSSAIHAHIGSQVFALAPFAQAVEVLAGFFAPLGLPELVVGRRSGGRLRQRRGGSPDGPVGALGARGVPAAGIARSVRVTAEPGRSIVAAAAVTLYRVGTVKDVPGHRTYVSVDGGMSDNPRPVLYGSGYEAFLPRETGAPRPMPIRLVGKHCETGDVLVSEGFVPDDLAVGDVLATPVTGAYGHSMASNYNKVPRPAVVFVADGEARTVVRRETFDDLVRLDV